MRRELSLHSTRSALCDVLERTRGSHPVDRMLQLDLDGFLPDLKAKKGEDTQYYQVQWVARIAGQAIASNNLQEAKAAARIAGLVLEDAAKAQ